jgi:hypothetical protein
MLFNAFSKSYDTMAARIRDMPDRQQQQQQQHP